MGVKELSGEAGKMKYFNLGILISMTENEMPSGYAILYESALTLCISGIFIRMILMMTRHQNFEFKNHKKELWVFGVVIILTPYILSLAHILETNPIGEEFRACM